MSGALAIRAAIHEALRGDEALLTLVNQVSDGTPDKASAPWLMLGEGVATGWGARQVDGVALRQPVQLALRGDDFARATAIMARVDTVLAGLDADLGDWRITSLRLARSRVTRAGVEAGCWGGLLLRLARSRVTRGRSGWRIDADYAVRVARLG